MELSNIIISRAIVHEAVRASMMDDAPPLLSEDLITLDTKTKRHISKRLTDTLASGSHCVEVTVSDGDKGSPFDRATSLLTIREKNYIATTKVLAEALSRAQVPGAIKTGSVFFITGSCVADNQPSRFVAIIKADSDEALLKTVKGDNVKVDFVGGVLMGASQRLIKIAFFIEDHRLEQGEEKEEVRRTTDFSVMVFDHLMQNRGDVDASSYFYRTFLHCELANDASRMTKRFFEATRTYINSMDIELVERHALRSDLITHMRSNKTTLDARSFAMEVLPKTHWDPFIQHCRTAGITKAINKDTELIKGKLRRQTLKFTSKVIIYGSPEVIRDSVKLKGMKDGWTEVAIKGEVDETV